MKKKVGFTLAEVLITLTIIGVVASLTLPSLNANTGSARNKAILKKTLSVLNNAALMNVARFGWDFSSINADSSVNSCDVEQDMTLCALLENALVGEKKSPDLNWAYSAMDKDGALAMANNLGSAQWFISYGLADGTYIAMNGMTRECTEAIALSGNNNIQRYCRGFIDTNGSKGPNAVIQCLNSDETKDITDNNYQSCEVSNNTNADMFPVIFYDSTVELASNAAKAFFEN